MYHVKLGCAYISDVDWCIINKDEIVINGIYVSIDGSKIFNFKDRKFANKVRKYCNGKMIKIYGNSLKY